MKSNKKYKTEQAKDKPDQQRDKRDAPDEEEASRF